MGNAPLNTGGNDGFDLKKLEESKSLYRDMDLDSRKINKGRSRMIGDCLRDRDLRIHFRTKLQQNSRRF